MASDQKEHCDDLLKRLREEILPLFEEISAEQSLSFPNPGAAYCWEVLDCGSPDCHLYGRTSGHGHCWQVPDPCCVGKQHSGGAQQKYRDCFKCEVLKRSCLNVIEQVGEYLCLLSLLVHRQNLELLESREKIKSLSEELDSAQQQLIIRDKKIQEMMITDKLTALFTRQHLLTVLEGEIARCQRFDRPVALIMVDIDDFKKFNESYGHQAGDTMLSFVASLIKENTRKFDRAFRYGEEEFAVVLPESDLTMAYIVAERIRKGFENKLFPVTEMDSGRREKVSRTVSVGITEPYAYGTRDVHIDTLIHQAETALFQAKEKGGNLCVRFE